MTFTDMSTIIDLGGQNVYCNTVTTGIPRGELIGPFNATTVGTTIQAAPSTVPGTKFQLPVNNGSSGNVLQTDGTGNTSWAVGGSGSGNVVGPASSVTGHLATFADATGRLLADGGAPGGGGGLPRQFGNVYIASQQPGIIGNGIADDTAALNTMFALAAGVTSGATFILDGFYAITNTITIGSNTGGNLTGPTSFINVLCTGGGGTTVFKYFGPNDGRPIIRFCLNKYFYTRGISIQNWTTINTGLIGTSIGLQLGGDGGTIDAGTACLGATMQNTNISNCFTGIQDGNFGDSSEIVWQSLVLQNCTTGWNSTGFNTLDHIFISPSMSGCGIGLDSGAAEGFHVFGGSSTQMGTSFNVQGNGICDVTGFRSELSKALVLGQGGSMTLRNCNSKANGLNTFVDNDPNAIVVGGNYDRLIIDSCTTTNGWIKLSSRTNYVSITNSFLTVDPTSNLPLLYSTIDSGVGIHLYLKNNENNSLTPAPQPNDFEGFVVTQSQDVNPVLQTLWTPQILKVPQSFLAANSGQTLGTDFLALSHLRQLSEAPVPGITNSTIITGVTNAATAAGSNVLHFAATPAGLVPGMVVLDSTTGGALPFEVQVKSTTGTTVVLTANATGGGVLNADTIQFYSIQSLPTPGTNLRVSGTFGTSNTLTFTFTRSITVTGPAFATQTITSTGLFLPTDAGKPIKIAGKGNNSWTDWFGYGYKFVDASHLQLQPGGGQTNVIINGSVAAVIGANEPDGNYIVGSIVGNAATPESYSVTAQTSTGFTLKSSNATSTATVTCLIVR